MVDREASCTVTVTNPFRRLQLSRRVVLPEKKVSVIKSSADDGDCKTSSFGFVFDEATIKPSRYHDDDEEYNSLNGSVYERGRAVYSEGGLGEEDVDLFMETSEELENTCLTTIAAVEQANKSSQATGRDALDAYIQKVFKITSARYGELCRQAAESECGELTLTCQVKSAAGLVPKDVNTSNEFFCRSAILSCQHLNSSLVKQKNILEWHKESMVGGVGSTSVKKGSLSPVWNEKTEMLLSNVNEEMLVVEVWGCGQNTAGGGKKQKSSFPTGPKKQSFVGRAFYALKTVPMEGEEKTMALYSHSAKHQRGRVKLLLHIRGLSEDTPIELTLREYKLLFQALVVYESKMEEKGPYIRDWSGKLSEEANTLLSHHAASNDISQLQANCVQLSVLLEYYKEYGLDLSVLHTLVSDIKVDRAEMPGDDDAEEPIWVKKVFHDMQEIHSLLLEVFRDHLTKYNLKSVDDIEQITEAIRILKELHSFWPFTKRLKPEHRRLNNLLAICIQTAVPRWFLELSKGLVPLESPSAGNECDMQLVAIRGLCVHCLRQCQRAQKSLNSIFSEVNVDYYTTFYTTMDRLLFSEVSPRLEKFKNYQDPLTYELYITFKDLAKMAVEHVNVSDRGHLQVLLFHEWFKGMPLNWIRMASKRCRGKLETSIGYDQQVDVDLKDDLRYSSSAVDTKSFLLQVGSFWKNLEWPVPEEAYGYLCTVIESISELALHYVDALYRSLLNESNLHDENGRFRASERLCVVLNNMYHVRRTLQEIPQFLKLDSYYVWLETNGKPESGNLGKKARELVKSVLDSSDEDIDTKISFFLDKINGRLYPDIDSFFEAIFPTPSHGARKRSITTADVHSTTLAALQSFQKRLTQFAWPDVEPSEKITDEQALAPLLSYLTANLQTLGDYLLTPVLLGTLDRLWKTIMDMLSTRLASIPRKPSSSVMYERLSYIIRELRKFFYAEGNGASLDDLNTAEYIDLKLRLKYRIAESRELILTYCSELVQHQETQLEAESAPLGTLQLSVGYLMDSQVLEVTIIQGKNFVNDLKNGVFVELHLLPRWLFTECEQKNFRTKAEKHTTNPLYSQEFRMPVLVESVGLKGGILLVEVFHDQHDLVGVCAIDCTSIPRLFARAFSLTNTDIPERKNLYLPLMNVVRTLALSELEERKEIGCADASNFFKANKRLFDHVH